ncbi:alpha/beta hydrolase [Rhodococcus spelaei]|uniref:Alpha/beta hydrolase n=1 Tax=Rhodococcus spelaei TaxID=2546320 RepID=A0A541BB00_9NOCA|nr:alpha/beta hydrolase [Rhodococcus spelaei]TQF69443.1 alpha/beta hydrolase [Rhodococcus spelaei]
MSERSRGTARRILLGTVAASAAVAAGAVVRSRRAQAAHALGAEPNAALRDPILHPETIPVVSADGHPIHTLAYGDPDAPVIVLSHGWTCSTQFWYPQVNALADEFRVVTYDQRGHGRTGLGPTPLAPALLGDDLDAVLSATVPEGRKAVVVGHSMGGMSIMSWALKYPERVQQKARAVMLASTGPDRLVAETTVIPLPKRAPAVPVPVGRAILGSKAPLIAPSPLTRRGVQYVAMAAGSTREEIDFCVRIVQDCSPATRGGWGRALSTLDIGASLDNLTVPTTVLVGTADRLTPPVHSVRMSDRLDAAGHLQRLIRLPGIGHMSTIEAPAAVNAEIVRLARL